MVLNALEASEEDDTVIIKAKQDSGKTCFSVWNKTVISSEIQPRIFQKNYTTKKTAGRGLGTYSMKIFGEDILQGKIWFHSDVETGTTFFFQR